MREATVQWSAISPRTAITQCIPALTDEIAAAAATGARPFYLSDGQLLEESDHGYVWRFTTEEEIVVPDDSIVKLEIGRRRYDATVVSTSASEVVLQTDESLALPIPGARLFTDPAFLLKELQNRLLERLAEGKADLRLIGKVLSGRAQRTDGGMAARHLEKLEPLNRYQRRAIAHVLTHKVSFIWGPPGTGKTTTLGHAVTSLIRNNESVLVVAHSNAAVDAAALAVGKRARRSRAYLDGRILRVGIARDLELRASYHGLLPREVVRRTHPALIEEIETLEAERDHLVRTLGAQAGRRNRRRRATRVTDALDQRPSPAVSAAVLDAPDRGRLEEVRGQLYDLRRRLRRAERELAGLAQVVLCTLSKAAIAEEIYGRSYDAVLVDEASMAYIPADLHVAGLATRRIAFFGDFRQLPPIVHADTPATKEWLATDIYVRAGIVERVDAGRSDPRLVMLEEQYRMHPRIAGLIKHTFYAGKLTTDREVAAACAPTLDIPPRHGHAVALLDTGLLHPLAFKEPLRAAKTARFARGQSRFNPLSALVATEITRTALAADRKTSVGVITPYRAQARLINSMLRDTRISSNRVACSTVHQFQGQERDLIVYDIVEGRPLRKVSRLLSSPDGVDEGRLLNVAVSRARAKLVVLANLAHLEHVLPESHIYRRVMSAMQERGNPVSLSFSKTAGAGIQAPDPLLGVTYYPRYSGDSPALRRRLLADLRHAGIVVRALPRHDATASPWVLEEILTSARRPIPRTYDADLSGEVRPATDPRAPWRGSSWPLLVVGMDERVLWIESAGYILRLEMPLAVKLLHNLWCLSPAP